MEIPCLNLIGKHIIDFLYKNEFLLPCLLKIDFTGSIEFSKKFTHQRYVSLPKECQNIQNYVPPLSIVAFVKQ